LITSRRPPEKEFVQSSRMEQCSLVATLEEQYVTIEIPKKLIRHWQHEGYTHLHYGAIRLILSLHRRRGPPVSARVSLLDSSFLHYENVVIGTILTTLHAGSVVLTMLQNHAVNLSLPSSTEDALFVMANPHKESPSIVQIPRNISRQQLEELIPLIWVINYEKLHENRKPLQTSEATFRRFVDGAKIPIRRVLPNGKPIFTDKINGHFIWDVGPSMCDPDCECSKDDDSSEDDEPNEEDKNKDHEYYWKPFPPPRRRSEPSSGPWIDIHQPKEPYPLWFQKRCAEILGKKESFSFPNKVSQPSIPCFMISGFNYEQEFSSLERIVDPTTRISTKPNISPTEIGPDGRSKPLTQAEEVLNWQTENAKVQNFML
ncbi:hypothetical protein V8G54_034483, partial [Vigna mungo]